MAIDLREIISLTDFQRNAKKHIVRLARTGKAQVLTVNGRASLVVQDADAYQRLLEQAEAGRNKTLSIVAATVPPPAPLMPPVPPAAAPKTEPPEVHVPAAHRTNFPTGQATGPAPSPKADTRHDQTTAIAAAMQELRKNFAKR
jgi:prevent-host-death family protein